MGHYTLELPAKELSQTQRAIQPQRNRWKKQSVDMLRDQWESDSPKRPLLIAHWEIDSLKKFLLLDQWDIDAPKELLLIAQWGVDSLHKRLEKKGCIRWSEFKGQESHVAWERHAPTPATAQ